jgi:precorrin-2 dehydrogenase / sirohydrochlorin ferrochelatase
VSAGVPLLVDLRGRRVVVVGAGPVAAAKVRSLQPAGPAVTVIAPDSCAEVDRMAAEGAVSRHVRRYAAGDLDGAHLAVAATADAVVNDAVAAEADERRIPCVRVDGGGSASLMGAVRRGPLTIAVASGVPALTRRVRARIGEVVDDAHGDLAALLADLRTDPRVRAALEPLPDAERAARWRAVLDTDILTLVRSGHIDSAKEVALACLSSSSG